MIGKILRSIKLLYETILFGAEETGKKAKPYAGFYIKGLLLLLLNGFVFPLFLLILGIIVDWGWLRAIGGIVYVLLVIPLLVWTIPFGILIEILTGGIKGSGQRYIKWATGVIVVGLCISLFASIIPIRANLPMFFILIVASLILGILNAWIFSRKVITALVSIIFILLILSFYFPTTFETLGEKISDIDVSTGEPERIYITQNSLERGEIKFFGPDGKPRVWYYRAEDGRFELFNRKGSHPIYKEKLKPVTPEVVSQIKNKLKVDEEMKRKESKRLEEERSVMDHENFLQRYLLSRNFLNKPESQEVAVIVIDEGTKVNQDISQKIASLLKAKGVDATPSLFTSSFVSDGIFEKIFKGDAIEVKKLELSKHSDYLMLGKKVVNFTENPQMQNMITAKASIEIHVISSKTATIEDSFTITEAGAGFSRATAEEMVIERILKKFAERSLKALP